MTKLVPTGTLSGYGKSKNKVRNFSPKMEKLNTRSLPGATGFSLQGGRRDPPLSAGSPPKVFKNLTPLCQPQIPSQILSFSCSFWQFFSSLSPKSGGKPCARNWYTHWSGDLPQLQGSIFWFFFFFCLLQPFSGSKNPQICFLTPKMAKKRPKNQEIKNLTPAIVESHETNVCTNF